MDIIVKRKMDIDNKYFAIGILVIGILLSLMNTAIGYFLLGFGASLTVRALSIKNGIQI